MLKLDNRLTYYYLHESTDWLYQHNDQRASFFHHSLELVAKDPLNILQGGQQCKADHIVY